MCKAHKVKACRDKYLHQCINHLDRVKAYIWETAPHSLSEYWEIMDRTHLRERAISVYLRGGLIRLTNFLQHRDGWFDSYQLGFGHFRLVTPGFTTQHYVPMAEFLQEVRQKKLGTHNPYVRLSTRDSQCLLLPHNTNLQDSVLMSI